jgi:16S rRNA (uracil1498-N3)-methyltransferase
MRIPRVYVDHELDQGDSIELSSSIFHRLSHVMRLSVGAHFTVFNGRGGEYDAYIVSMSRRMMRVAIGDYRPIERESLLQVTLYQSVSHRDKMDWIIQKATELGVFRIAPIITDYSVVKLTEAQWKKRKGHWKSIISSACEQCGRNRLPELETPIRLMSRLESLRSKQNIVLSPDAKLSFDNVDVDSESIQNLGLFIGPEGGFSEAEEVLMRRKDFIEVSLGPRILRMETAAIAAIVIVQRQWGDF